MINVDNTDMELHYLNNELSYKLEKKITVGLPALLIEVREAVRSHRETYFRNTEFDKLKDFNNNFRTSIGLFGIIHHYHTLIDPRQTLLDTLVSILKNIKDRIGVEENDECIKAMLTMLYSELNNNVTLTKMITDEYNKSKIIWEQITNTGSETKDKIREARKKKYGIDDQSTNVEDFMRVVMAVDDKAIRDYLGFAKTKYELMIECLNSLNKILILSEIPLTEYRILNPINHILRYNYNKDSKLYVEDQLHDISWVSENDNLNNEDLYLNRYNFLLGDS